MKKDTGHFPLYTFRSNLICSFLVLLLLFGIPQHVLKAQQPNWLTYYEQSGHIATPRYAETMAFVDQLDAKSDNISVIDFGISPEGRVLKALVYDHDGLSDPQQIRGQGRMVLMVQACIHPGESEGKDAMLMLLRDLVVHRQYIDLFQDVSLLFIPIFNVDGHERFGPYGRINQNGPKEMGWRTTAQNLNLNRDYLKADAPEMQAWLRLYHRWQPEFFIDTHTSDGADYQYTITYALETGGQMDAALTEWQTGNYLPPLEKLMEKAGFPLFPYVSFRRWHDPRSGLVSGIASPMFSQGYTAVRNRPGLLVETHMLKPYHQRVDATRAIILSTLEILQSQHTRLQQLVMGADRKTESPNFIQQPFAVNYEVDMQDSSMVAFKGVRYDVTQSELTGGNWFIYKPSEPETFMLPMFDKSRPKELVRLPAAYIVPPAWQQVLERMQLHGIEMYPIPNAQSLPCNVYHFDEVKWNSRPMEGRHRITELKLHESTGEQMFPAGSMVIPMQQPLARLIAFMLEPKAAGSLVEWGFFDIVFEQKEYAETYVMEPLARKMLDSIPGLRERYEAKKAAEPDFASGQWQQLNWFYSQTPWWDKQYMRYPVGRIMKNEDVPGGVIRSTK